MLSGKCVESMKPLMLCLVCVLVLSVVIGAMGGIGIESFGFFDNLWPSRDRYCEERGMDKSYMPQKCIILDKCGKIRKWDRYRNCRCVDRKTGYCKTCYPRVNPITNSVSVYADDV